MTANVASAPAVRRRSGRPTPASGATRWRARHAPSDVRGKRALGGAAQAWPGVHVPWGAHVSIPNSAPAGLARHAARILGGTAARRPIPRAEICASRKRSNSFRNELPRGNTELIERKSALASAGAAENVGAEICATSEEPNSFRNELRQREVDLIAPKSAPDNGCTDAITARAKLPRPTRQADRPLPHDSAIAPPPDTPATSSMSRSPASRQAPDGSTSGS